MHTTLDSGYVLVFDCICLSAITIMASNKHCKMSTISESSLMVLFAKCECFIGPINENTKHIVNKVHAFIFCCAAQGLCPGED